MNVLIYMFWICLGLTIYPYMIYPIILFLLNAMLPRYSAKREDTNEQLPSVSILIAAYNEEETMAEKINNCLALDYPPELLRIWVASDGSTDRTNEIVKSFCPGEGPVTLLEFPRTGKSGILNKAMQYLKSDIVVFTDANVMLDRNSLKEFVKHFKDHTVGCVSAKLVRYNATQVMSGKGEIAYWSYETMIKKMESNLGYMAGASGTAYAIRRELFIPFYSNTINDDFELTMGIVQKGFKCVYEERAISFEEVAPSMKSEFGGQVRDAAGHYIAIMHLKGLLNPFLGIRFLVFFSHRFLRWFAPFMLITILVLNSILYDQPFFRSLLVLQAIFYSLAMIGWALAAKKHLPFFFYAPFYFCSLNMTLLLGFGKAITGKQRAKWDSTERT